MQPEGVVFLTLICMTVIGIYALILIRRGRKRERFFIENGFFILERNKSRNIASKLKIKSKGASSMPIGSKVYVAPGVGGYLVVCDLVVSVGIARYSGFSKVTVLGFIGEIENKPNFLMRKAGVMETRWELRSAFSLKNGWYAWCAEECLDYLDGLAQRVDALGRSVILRKKGSFLSFYFQNKYIHEREIEKLLPEWEGFCEIYNEINK